MAKHAGLGNVILEEVPVPEIGPRDVLIRNHVTLISRGSEILSRYMKQEAVDPGIMGYSAAGVIEAVGADISELEAGDRVASLSPHAEFAVMNIELTPTPRVVALPESVSFETATLWPLVCSSVVWSWTAGPQPGEVVAVVGQGLVGSIIIQVLKRLHHVARVIAIDAAPLRCDFAAKLGADVVINARDENVVARVRELTGGRGADVIVETVGGAAGIQTFPLSLSMTASGGRLVLVSLYHGAPLPLDARAVMDKSILGANLCMSRRAEASDVALSLLADGSIAAVPMVTHRFGFADAKAAFDLLYNHMDETMAVLLMWN